MLRLGCFFFVVCLFAGSFPCIVHASPSYENLGDAVRYQNEIVLDGQVGYTAEGMVMFTDGNRDMVVLDGIIVPYKHGHYITVVGFPYKKGDYYHISVTGYTFIAR